MSRPPLDLFCGLCKHYMKCSVQVQVLTPDKIPKEIRAETLTTPSYVYRCQDPKCGFVENFEKRPTK